MGACHDRRPLCRAAARPVQENRPTASRACCILRSNHAISTKEGSRECRVRRRSG
ncbi:hypothetical protein AOX55_00002137 [Sinorhizobium fredii CCBAU 25509]|nr:hypothetical protein SF83666_c18350 [Sinorhizobium fredii CCBAU 83666]AWM25389.1 hypothetical protein AOX55_00002137 [Sinorhizobium fredii CCBAU 25509]